MDADRRKAGLRSLLDAVEEVRRETRAGDGAGETLGPGAAEQGEASFLREPEHGDRFGEFVIEELLGRGGEAAVYRARREPDGELVALKVLSAVKCASPRARERFRREAETLAALGHPGIVPVLGVGEEGGRPYYVMERLPGPTLREVLRKLREAESRARPGRLRAGRPSCVLLDFQAGEARVADASEPAPPGGCKLDPQEATGAAVEWIAQVADALQHAHESGVIHRDVKPDNLLFNHHGRPTITDFGTAKDLLELTLTRTGEFLGTPGYLSPEQAMGRRVPADHRTDVYALGVTLYELLTLRQPFLRQSDAATLRALLFEHPPPLRRVCRGASVDLETVVHRALEKDPDQRIPSAQVLEEDLRRVQRGEPVRTAAFSRRAWAQRSHGHRSVRRPLLVGALLAVALAGGVLLGAPLLRPIWPWAPGGESIAKPEADWEFARGASLGIAADLRPGSLDRALAALRAADDWMSETGTFVYGPLFAERKVQWLRAVLADGAMAQRPGVVEFTGDPDAWVRRNAEFVLERLAGSAGGAAGSTVPFSAPVLLPAEAVRIGDGPMVAGAILPISGSRAAAGRSIVTRLEAAYRERPWRGALLVEDSGSDATHALSAFYSLEQAGAELVIGPLESGASEAVEEAARAAALPLIVAAPQRDASPRANPYASPLAPGPGASTAVDLLRAGSFSQDMPTVFVADLSQRVWMQRSLDFLEEYHGAKGRAGSPEYVLGPEEDWAEFARRVLARGPEKVVVSASSASTVAFLSALARTGRNMKVVSLGSWAADGPEQTLSGGADAGARDALAKMEIAAYWELAPTARGSLPRAVGRRTAELLRQALAASAAGGDLAARRQRARDALATALAEGPPAPRVVRYSARDWSWTAPRLPE